MDRMMRRDRDHLVQAGPTNPVQRQFINTPGARDESVYARTRGEA